VTDAAGAPTPEFGGDIVGVGGNQPLLLHDGDVWLVREGGVDVFGVPVAADGAAGRRRHLARVDPGGLVFGISPRVPLPGPGLLAVGVAGTRLERVPSAALADPAHAAKAVPLAEAWIVGVVNGLVRRTSPHDATLLEPGATSPTLPAGAAAGAGAPLVWIRVEGGTAAFLGEAEAPLAAGDAWWPLTPSAWIGITADARLECVDTATLLQRNAFWPALPGVLGLALTILAVEARQTATAEGAHLAQGVEATDRLLGHAVQGLTAILERPAGDVVVEQVSGDAFLDACALVAAAAGIEIRRGSARAGDADPKNRLSEVARVSRFRTRSVGLEGDWWRRDSGPLLGSRRDGRPVALLPESPTRYVLVDPEDGRRTRVDDRVAGTLADQAVMFYRPLPERDLTVWDIFRFSRRGLGRDALVIFGLGILGGLLGMLTPIATGTIFDTLIPSGDRTRLVQMAMGLVVAALAAGVFDVVRSIALLRVSGKIDGALQAATWDRLLALPVPFFRNYSSGDLATRANAVDAIQQTLTGVVLSSILSALFSLFSLALMFWYEIRLTLVALGLVLVVLVVTTAANYVQLRRQRVLLRIQGAIAGLVLQLINGIDKLRVAGAEPRAFTVWAARFASQRRTEFQARRVAYSVSVFTAAFNVLALLVVFFAVWHWPNPAFDTGTFLSFNAAFGQFMAAVLGMAGAVTSAITVVPLYERARPILTTPPEVDQARVDPGRLKGAIAVTRVSFRYRADGPVVLHELSLEVKPGEFAALVGPSGAGKSTIYRLLLGFDTPLSGTIFYDGQDLAGLDLRAVRRQIGVVLQNGKLLWGSIYQNIVGAAPLTLDEAWEAAREAGLEEDIKAMPMGMQTFIGEGATTFSGGQRQRLMIARAIVGKPRIVLLDEATSALDNETQAIVSDSLARLNTTRLVIAHRLSTIVKADTIHVIEAGRVVESGDYQALMARSGAFAALAARQIA
jgi:ATP-binding cassette subfamily C protein